jgi:hypothetical protein
MFTTSPSRHHHRARETFTPVKVDPSALTTRDQHRAAHDVSPGGDDMTTPLHRRVDAALTSGDPEQLHACRFVPPADERDELLALLSLQDLALAPVHQLGPKVDFHGHPSAAELQHRLDHSYLDRLRRRSGELRLGLPDGVAGMRRAASLDRVPAVYEWLRDQADWDQMVMFLTVEGGPDAGFDDLVALAQVGIRGVPKVALGLNYWDEMGRGRPERVHTELHHRLVDAIGMPRRPRASLDTPVLDRMALNGVLATRRWLQPELLGALGLIELQAGPRCRAVVGALERLGAGEAALDFYREHAEADPRHGKDWLDRVVEPLAEDRSWARRMVDGAVWRHVVNDRFFRWWQRSG